jgi:hypothetical protein
MQIPGKSGRPQLLVYRFLAGLSPPMREMRPTPNTFLLFRPCYAAEKHPFMDAH